MPCTLSRTYGQAAISADGKTDVAANAQSANAEAGAAASANRRNASATLRLAVRGWQPYAMTPEWPNSRRRSRLGSYSMPNACQIAGAQAHAHKMNMNYAGKHPQLTPLSRGY